MKAKPLLALIRAVLFATQVGVIPIILELLPYSLHATEIDANFDGGNSSSIVDAYPGTAGTGWLGPWTCSGGSISFSNSVLNASPLGGGGNYLDANLTVTATASGWYPGTIGRKFDTTIVSSTSAYSVAFLVRLDTAMAIQSDALNIMGDTASGWVGGSGPTNSFYINGYYNFGSPTWRVQDGDTNGGVDNIIDTGVALTVGTVYSFVVDVDPVNQSYIVSIYDGVTLYTSPPLGLRCAAFDGGNSLYVYAAVRDTTHAMGFSLDSVSISTGAGGSQEAVTNLTDVPWTDPGPPPDDPADTTPRDDSVPLPDIPPPDDTTIQDGL